MELPRLDPNLSHLADVVPSVFAALGVPGFDARIPLRGGLTGACVLLIDGLGAELLDTYAQEAPVLAGMRGATLQVGFPSTTVAGLAAIGTGCTSGEHGMVGYTFRMPGAGVVNALRWRPHPWGDDLRDAVPPERIQARPTAFERATAAGMAVTVVNRAEFVDSGMTRAVLRGGRYVGVQGLGDLAAGVRAAVAAGGFCYGYHGDLDLLGHLYGPGSEAWRMQLRQVDRLVESVLDGLPPGGLLVVVADHGMVAVDPAELVDVDGSASLKAGVDGIGGEARARHVYTADGAVADVVAAWRAELGDRAWVVTRDEAIDAGWFGERVADHVRPRIGDVVAAARGSAAIVRRTVEPIESALVGQHGSLTTAEQRIPLLIAYG
ncbi:MULTISPECIES: alkaline phosphatase family protein [unclassified Mycobacterium]|uniref:alkaline phosphatase family protein n=1 Tax=unclassified Mycobacterium TaxID=2642494 RepID=UPI0029C832CF|nr:MULTISPECIES: alkaline phosphatase family protein [unclassified Mycobacterium]